MSLYAFSYEKIRPFPGNSDYPSSLRRIIQKKRNMLRPVDDSSDELRKNPFFFAFFSKAANACASRRIWRNHTCSGDASDSDCASTCAVSVSFSLPHNIGSIIKKQSDKTELLFIRTVYVCPYLFRTFLLQFTKYDRLNCALHQPVYDRLDGLPVF